MRKHSGGFIVEDSYLNIGTEDARGRDGDNARIAAKKYNDHKHPAHIAQSIAEANAWSQEPQLESSVDGISGGYLENDATKTSRTPGDLVSVNSYLFCHTEGSNISPINMGLGGQVQVINNVTTFKNDILISRAPLTINSSLVQENLPLNTDVELTFAKGVLVEDDYTIYNADTDVIFEVVAGINRPTGPNFTDLENRLFNLNGELVGIPTVSIIIAQESFNSNELVTNATNNATTNSVRIERFKDINPFTNSIAYELAETTLSNTVDNKIYFVSYRRSNLVETYSGNFDAQDIIDTNYNGEEQDFLNELNIFWSTCSFDIMTIQIKIKSIFGAGL